MFCIEDGPPELVFQHGGHTGNISDFSWSKTDDWVVASVSEDNILHVWRMADDIMDEEDGDEDLEDEDLEGGDGDKGEEEVKIETHTVTFKKARFE